VNSIRTFNIVFAICHPDDEALWIGGLLCELSRLPFVRSYVICLSGNDSQSPRMQEFDAGRAVAGYASGLILGGPLRQAIDPLPNTARTLERGIELLGIDRISIDLLITHSPYGDEHRHPHHVQTHRELKRWCNAANVPFGFFSCIPLPWISHKPIMTELRRRGSFQLLTFARCTTRGNVLRHRIKMGRWLLLDRPKYYLQFLTDYAAKAEMLNCYRSIDLALHEKGYAMFTNPCEALYLMDDRALAPWRAVIDAMDVPGSQQLIMKDAIFFHRLLASAGSALLRKIAIHRRG